jgi:hypothetical protein
MADESKKKAYYDSLVRAGVVPPEVSYDAFNLKIRDTNFAKIVYSGLKTASELGIVKDIPSEQQFNSVLQSGQFPTQPELSEDIPEVKEIKEMGVPASKQTAIPPVSNIPNQPQPTAEETQIAPIDQQAGQVQGGMPQARPQMTIPGMQQPEMPVPPLGIFNPQQAKPIVPEQAKQPQGQQFQWSGMIAGGEPEKLQVSPVSSTSQMRISAEEKPKEMALAQIHRNAMNQGELATLVSSLSNPTPESIQRIAQINAEMENAPQSEAMQNLQKEGSFANMLQATPEVIYQSLASMIRSGYGTILGSTAAGAAVGSTIPVLGNLAGAGYGLGTGMVAAGSQVEYASSLMEGLRQQGVNVSNPNELSIAFSNPNIINNARKFAAKRTAAIMVFDAATMGVAGKLGVGRASSTLGNVARLGGELGIQAAGGSAGEAFAQFVSGQEINPQDIIMEGLGELGGAPGDIFSAKLRAVKSPEQVQADANRMAANAPMNAEQVDAFVNTSVEAGFIAPDNAEQAKTTLNKANELNAKIPAEIKDTELRVAAIGLIEERDNLNAQLETVDEAFRPAIQEKIKAINEQLAGMATPEVVAETIPTPAPQETPQEAPVTPATTGQQDIQNRKRKDLLPDETEFANVIGGSNSNSNISSYREVNGIGIAEYTNPNNGLVDVIMTGTSDNDYVGYVRIYENGKPTNRWTSKMENKSGNKDNFKTMITEVQKLLPENHEYTEKTNISLDGVRVYANNLNRGYEIATDKNGNPIINNVPLNNATLSSLQSTSDPDAIEDLYNTRTGITREEFNKIKEQINSLLPNTGLLYNEANGSVIIQLPVLRKSPATTGQQATPATTEVATEAVTETPTGTTAEVEVKLAELPTKTIEAEVVSETPVAGAEANPALADVESTAKALEGVDKETEDLSTALMVAEGSLKNNDLRKSKQRDKFIPIIKSLLKEGEYIGQSFKGQTSESASNSISQTISSAYHSAKAKPESERTAQETELITQVEQLLTPTQDAVQKQTAGQVPVQSGTTSSQEVAEGEPKAEPQGTANKGQTQETGKEEVGGETPAEVASSEIANISNKTSVRDLASMQDGEVSAGVFSELNKGDKITIGGNEYVVTTKTKGTKKTEFKKKDGTTSFYTKSTLTLKEVNPDGSLGKPISGTFVEYENGRTLFTGGNQWNNLSRDIEGDVTIDLINENNKFHTPSQSFKLAQQYVDKINSNLPKEKAGKPTTPTETPGKATATQEAPTGEVDKSTEELLDETLSKYGWSKEQTKKGYNIKNSKGNTVAIAEVKSGGKYTIYDASGAKLLSGNKDVVEAVEKVATEYFFAKPKPATTTPTTTPTTEVTLNTPNETTIKDIEKIENATEKGRELALSKPVNKWVKRAFDTFQDLSDRAKKAGIYDGTTLKIGGKEYTVDTPAKFKAFLAQSQANFDAINEAVDKSEIDVLKAERDTLIQEFIKGMGKATMNLNPQQVSSLAQIAWKNLQILLKQTKLSSAGVASQIKKVVDNAILEVNQILEQSGQTLLNPDKDDITNIINGVRKLAEGIVVPPSQNAGQIGTPGQPSATQSPIYTKEQEELARQMEKKMDEGKPFISRSEPFWTAVKRKTAELRQKLDSPKELLNFVEKMIGTTPGSSYNRTRELPLGRAMEQLRGKARSLALPYMERISEILKPIESNLPDFEKYLIYRRIIDRAIQDKANQEAYNQGLLKKKPVRRTTGGMTETNADILLNNLRNKIGADMFDKFTQAGDDLQQVFDDNLKDLVDAGVLTQDRYDAIKAQNEFYIPFDVVQRDFRGNVITGTEYDRSTAQGQKVIREIKGIDTPKNAADADKTIEIFYKMMQNGDIDVDSYYYLATEKITDARNQGNITQQEYEELMDSLSEPGLELHSPLNKTLNIINASQYQVARQGYMEDVDRLVDADTNNDYFKRLEDGEKLPSGMAIITYYKDGVQQRVAVDEKLKQAIDGMTKPELSAFEQVLKVASIPFKIAATSASVTFLPVNFVIDTVRTLTSKAGLGSGANITERAASVIQIPVLYSEALVESIIGNLLNTKLGNALGLKSITPEFMYNQYEDWRKSPSYSEGTYMNYFTDKLKSGRTKSEIEDAKFLETVQRRTQTILGKPETAKAIANAMLGAKQKTRMTVDGLFDIINLVGKMLENSHKIYGNIKLSGTEAGVRKGLDRYIGGYIDKLHGQKKLTQAELENALEEINDEVLNNIGSPNFEQIPPNMRAASILLPFFGAAVKGNMTDISRMLNSVNTGASKKERKDALVFAARNAAVFTIPAFMTGLAMALKDDDDEDKKMYDEMDENSKWKNMIIPIQRDVDGEGVQTDFITVPVRGLPVVFNSIGRASGQALGMAMKEKLTKEELKNISKDLLYSSGSEMMTFNLADKTYLSDIDPETGERKERRKEEEWVNRSMSAISGLNPLIKAPLERVANKNFFGKYPLFPENIRGKRLRNAILNEVIDPETGEPISPSLLKNKFTPEYSVNLSKKLERNGIRITPIAIDHFFDSFLAGAPEKYDVGAYESMKRRFLWKERKLAYGEKPKN